MFWLSKPAMTQDKLEERRSNLMLKEVLAGKVALITGAAGGD